jgi:ABC-type uncharacterized transport system ATPase subunit
MRAEAGAMVVRFDVHGAGPDARFGGLSGGTRQKAAPARELIMANLKFLPAVQPTRSLDVRAVEAVCGLTRSACAGGAGVPPVSSELTRSSPSPTGCWRCIAGASSTSAPPAPSAAWTTARPSAP